MSWLSHFLHRDSPAASEELPAPLTALATDTGCRRSQNEDSARVVCVPTESGRQAVLLVVADGMGGHEAGEVASQAAVETIEKEFRQLRGSPGDCLLKAFRRAHTVIFQMASTNPSMAGMGTTCTALVIDNNRAWAAHIGDSRLYLLRDCRLYQLSQDHTQCMELVRRGVMDEATARHHEDRNVLIRAMGTRPEFEPQTWREPMEVRRGDSFVLCSDGLHDLVADEEIGSVVGGADPAPACRQLVQMARDRGGFDNITVAVAAVPAAGRPVPALRETRHFEVQK